MGGGNLTKGPRDSEGTWLNSRVADNGEGQAAAAPDQPSRTGWIGQEPEDRNAAVDYCETQPDSPWLRDIEAGNIQVRG